MTTGQGKRNGAGSRVGTADPSIAYDLHNIVGAGRRRGFTPDESEIVDIDAKHVKTKERWELVLNRKEQNTESK